ncbi:hypothetical protein AB1Y20_006159 [Prymnesium parvum]|uniref:50S ribosomal protein L11, chloroplastic n=1 Tax=Prymnesium parvum TaxID=97485 RepID=A0AB34J561_PRYPA|mmetsp:Transcript_30733/g.76742  ORF Transcript_30733/g.76742 Transcript_30733/m.76742 type:complete len:198 (+) Transcript_30733:51-644(+)|eukprot:CAMPEP_0182823386 /NCGR_PEP_ID=MMETSP0006_2-20121128/14722_1 /TAXON_ID=97485 /ORGANISM="Prymnesium parvum, Strain Texoma1" /LENGTH=197 /DNA_ID=CAMNT_0024950299 /DNA_START=51 /DNA_END=644 /DNA_ORIENTATION=-
MARTLLHAALLLCLPTEAPAFTTLPAVRQSAPRAAWSRGALRVGRPRAEPLMMAKKVTKIIKLALAAGKANPAPPVGPALGAAGVNIMMFCKEYNARTQDQAGTIIPVEITVFEDRSFTFVLKTPPASELLKKAAKVPKGSGTPGGRAYVKAGTVTMAQVEEIAKIKLPDLNTNKIQSAMNTVMGTAKNMGIVVEDA